MSQASSLWQQELQEVLSYPPLKARIQGEGDLKRVEKSFHEMKTRASRPHLRAFGWFLRFVFSKIYQGIHFDANGLDLAKLAQAHCVVLVPNHISHTDYLALSYVIDRDFHLPPFIAGGRNLNIFPIGGLFRRCGCFFIRRSFYHDPLYKLTLESYLCVLLKRGRPIEFFFEGGRSKTGKLSPPRYGLYQMLIEAHGQIFRQDGHKSLLFIPVGLAYEIIPDAKGLARALREGDGPRGQETPKKIFKLVRLVSHRLGRIHIRFGHPVCPVAQEGGHLRQRAQRLAFDCFEEVGRNILVTPTSILSLVLLDGSSGVFRPEDIISRAVHIRNYCQEFGIPLTDSLEGERCPSAIEAAIDMFVKNKKMDLIRGGTQRKAFYVVREDARGEILYFKNGALHHFLTPGIINMALGELLKGNLSTVKVLKEFLMERRNMFKHEFYLPGLKDMFQQALGIVSQSVGKNVSGLEDIMALSSQELYRLATKISPFLRAFNYINESYWVTGVSIRALCAQSRGTKIENIEKKAKEIFQDEKALGRTIHYPESFSILMVRSSIRCFEHGGRIHRGPEGHYTIVHGPEFEEFLLQYERILSSSFHFHFEGGASS